MASRAIRRQQNSRGGKVRLQSVMEYLETYGWVVLIIAVFLAAGYQLGIFTNINYNNVCVPQTTFYCSRPVLSSNGNLSLTFGQATGDTITLTSVGCSNSPAVPPVFRASQNVQMTEGTETNLVFQCPISSGKFGTPFSGTLWITYNSPVQSSVISLAMSVQATVATEYSPTPPTQQITQSAYADLSHTSTAKFLSPVSNGDWIVAVFSSLYSGSCSPPAISDSLGGSWTTITSQCNAGAAGNKYQYSSISYAVVPAGGTESVTASPNTGQGILVVYDLSPAPTSFAVAAPGSGTKSPSAYTTGQLSFANGAALIAGISESSGGNCCIPSTGFSSYGVGVGWGSEFSSTASSPTDFPIVPSSQGTNGWAEVGAAFER